MLLFMVIRKQIFYFQLLRAPETLIFVQSSFDELMMYSLYDAFKKHIILRSPVNTEEVDDYLEYVKNPMDFEKMHQKLDDGEYSCAQVTHI